MAYVSGSRVRIRVALHLVLAAILALVPLGCAHRRPEPVAAPPEKPAPGTVALVMSDAVPTGHFQQPGVVGRGRGAKEGAKTGAVAPFVPGAVLIASRDGNGVFAGLMLLGAGLALAPVGAAVGAAAGAIAAPSREDVERSTAALERALADARLTEGLVVWILEAGGSQSIIPPIIGHPDTVIAEVDTFLAFEAPHVSLTSKDPTDWQPGLRLLLSVRAKLLRASNGQELRTWSWEHEGRKARFLEWAQDDARMFREELERAGRALAAQAIRDLY